MSGFAPYTWLDNYAKGDSEHVMKQKSGFSRLVRKELMVDGQAIKYAEALGSCGFNTTGTVDVAHVRGISLFVFESALSKENSPFYTCVVMGVMSCGANSREEALAEGVRRARGNPDTDRRISIQQLEAMATDPTVHTPYDWEATCH